MHHNHCGLGVYERCNRRARAPFLSPASPSRPPWKTNQNRRTNTHAITVIIHHLHGKRGATILMTIYITFLPAGSIYRHRRITVFRSPAECFFLISRPDIRFHRAEEHDTPAQTLRLSRKAVISFLRDELSDLHGIVITGGITSHRLGSHVTRDNTPEADIFRGD